MNINPVISSILQIPDRSHANLLNLGADDHAQYLNTARHDVTARHAAAVIDVLPASKITSGRFALAQLPDAIKNRVLMGQGVGSDPIMGSLNHLYGGVGFVGGYYPWDGSNWTNYAYSANYLYGMPVLLPGKLTFDRISVDVQTAAGTTSNRLGIYKDNGSFMPGALVLDAGTVDTSTTGVKEITINQALEPGIYWLAWVSAAAPTLYGHNPVWYNLDSTFPIALPTRSVVSRSFSYAALPDPFGGSPAAETKTHGIYLRISAIG